MPIGEVARGGQRLVLLRDFVRLSQLNRGTSEKSWHLSVIRQSAAKGPSLKTGGRSAYRGAPAPTPRARGRRRVRCLDGRGRRRVRSDEHEVGGVGDGAGDAGDGDDAVREGLAEGFEGGHDAGDGAGEQGLARAGRAGHEDVVSAASGDLNGALDMLLAADVGEVDGGGGEAAGGGWGARADWRAAHHRGAGPGRVLPPRGAAGRGPFRGDG